MKRISNYDSNKKSRNSKEIPGFTQSKCSNSHYADLLRTKDYLLFCRPQLCNVLWFDGVGFISEGVSNIRKHIRNLLICKESM
jgi:hypothetical protein